MTTKKSLFNQLQVQFNWKVAFIVTVSLIVLVKLGFWQLDRAKQKQQMQTEIQLYKLTIPHPIESLVAQSKQSLNYHRVQLTGHYLNHKSIYISNKFYQGRAGYEVITPFKLKSSESIVLVSRGWIALSYQQNQLPAIDMISGEQQLVGTIYLATGKSFFLPEKIQQKNWPIRLHHFQIDTISELLKTPVLPYVVRLEPGNQGILQAFWPAVNFNAGRSTAYAIQWFMMALALLIISIIRGTNIVQLIRSV